jgi:hypothetical protein
VRGQALAVVACGLFTAAPGRTEPVADVDRYDVWARSETHAELFQRALLPGPNGAVVSRATVAPVTEYVLVRARDLDTAWQKDSIELEFAAWSRLWLGERDSERSVDGDVQTANVRYSQGPVALRLGRQHVAGGAARYARFDGAALELELGAGMSVLGYGGFTVLPRWDARPGYAYLGSAADSELRAPDAVPEPNRKDHWQSGGRLGWARQGGRAGVSFHEQREFGGLARRNLGADGQVQIGKASLGGSAVLELDARRFADARLWADAQLTRSVSLALEYLHAEPALFLSRQSVLSVFSNAAYEETGGTIFLRASEQLRVDAGGWAELYEGDQFGGRGELTARFFAERSRRTLIRVTYARVQAPDNGYHSLRSALARQFLPRLTGTLEAYAYLYDQAIRGYRASTVQAGTLGFHPNEMLELVFGTSLLRSAYARADLQTQVQLRYDFEASNRRGAR